MASCINQQRVHINELFSKNRYLLENIYRKLYGIHVRINCPSESIVTLPDWEYD